MLIWARSAVCDGSSTQWCSFETMANKSPSSCSMTHVSQSGRARSSGWTLMRATFYFSSSIVPGRGSAAWRTWKSRLKCGSSIHTG